MPDPTTCWPHAPTHLLGVGGTFFVTASTYRHEHVFRGSERVRFLHDQLLRFAAEHRWHLEAWAVFSNHYHFVGHSPPDNHDAMSLRAIASRLHETTAKWANGLDDTPGRRVWHNYWETRLTYQKSYLARLSYVHRNPEKHGVVAVANQYPWCSAAWLERTARPAQIRALYRFRIDRLVEGDDFEVAPEW
ncbi:MAG: hypothetical protein DVB31_16675 [Verrucomicrobia bacterium]|nr:MAG: hypothetical protein DVB31_16675 [Verrucomicrobiota bacterium]